MTAHIRADDAAHRVAVVGAHGFLGSALVQSARDAGLEVAEFTRSVPFVGADGSAAEGMAAAGTVYWMASLINPAVAESHPDLVEQDAESFGSMLRAVADLDEPPLVVLPSSGGTVYDDRLPPPFVEQGPTRPRSAYGRAKLALEHDLATALPDGGGVVARMSNVYGPGQPAVRGQGVIGYWLRAAQQGADLDLYGDPASTRDYVYVHDVVDALLAVHRADPTQELPPVLNIGSGRATSLGDLAGLVLAAADRPGLTVRHHPARGFDVPHTWLDCTLATQALGWSASTPLTTGISRAWAALAPTT